MRTLKKSLCLVLALVFVLGLCTFGTSAATAPYTDIAKVNYGEAVEVLTGLGVIEGYPDGSFNPTANVTRAEAAAMIARMMLGRDKADRLPVGDVKFSDVPETNWAAKYIAFCANKGIIVGTTSTCIPSSLARLATATASSSWFSPSVMRMIARLASLCSPKQRIEVLSA